MAWEGHFRPLVPLAHALATRGHEVVFAAASAWEPRVAEEGFALFPAGLTRAEGGGRFAPFRAKIFALPPEGRRTHQFSKLFGMIHAPAKLPELLGVARSWHADAIVHDSCDLAAPIAAASLGQPSVNHSFGAMVPSPETVRAALGRVLGESAFAEAARRIAAEIQEMATVDEAATAVEEYVTGG